MKHKLIENLNSDKEAMQPRFKIPHKPLFPRHLYLIIMSGVILLMTIGLFISCIRYNNSIHYKYLLLKENYARIDQENKDSNYQIKEFNSILVNKQRESGVLKAKLETLNQNINEINMKIPTIEQSIIKQKAVNKDKSDEMYLLFNEINTFKSVQSMDWNDKFFHFNSFSFITDKSSYTSSIIKSKEEFDYIEEITGYKIGKPCFSSVLHKFMGQLFRNYCKEITPTVSLYLTENNNRFGGFTKVDWGKDDMKVDNDAFIFNLDTRTKWVAKNNHENIQREMGSFPSFGDGDIKANAQGLCSVNKFHKSFELNHKEYEINGGYETFRILSVEVFQMYMP